MFLLVSVRHVGAHLGEHQHGVSIQISIYVPPFISQILDFILLKSFDFYSDLF